MRNLRGKKAVVTGGGMGIGLETCKRLVREGCEVTIWDMNEQAMKDACKLLEKMGGRIFAYKCDVSDKARVFELAEQARKDMGQVDILINNAGFVKVGRFTNQALEVWEKETHVNLTAMYYTIYAFLPEMLKRNWGHIVNISSGAGVVGVPNLAVYCASKWAVWGLTESLRLEALADKKDGVMFSSIHPNFLKHGMFEGGSLNFFGQLLVPNIETHDEIAAAIVEDGLKKGRNVVKRPRTLHLILMGRSVLPDRWLMKVLLLLGSASSMEKWTGRPGMEHAS